MNKPQRRPPKKQITFRFSDEQRAWLDQRASCELRPMGEIVRELIQRAMEKKEKGAR